MMSEGMGMKRRQALKALAGATGALMWPQQLLGVTTRADALGSLLPERILGRTGKKVTMLGLGGWHVGKLPKREAQALIEAALAGGVRFFDTAESYQDGGSESLYGEFLTPKYRDDVFLMTKTTARDALGVRQHLEGSLRRLRTDVLDLWQVHSLLSPEDVDGRLAGGVVEEVLKQQAAGRVRHIGFTGHKVPAAMQRMLDATDVFEACQMPINVLDPSYESFVSGVLPTLVERNIGTLAMKTLANGHLMGVGLSDNTSDDVVPDRLSLRQALSFAWSLPISVLIYGPDNVAQLEQTLQVAHTFDALSAEARQQLVAHVADLAGRRVEYYKA